MIFPKPEKGAKRAEARARRAHEVYIETKAKRASKARDGFRCRRPGCTSRTRLESAHLEDAGMGGRHAVSNERKCYLSACYECHQGRRSLHSGHLRCTSVVPELGADGALLWEEKIDGQWTAIGID